MRGDHRMLARFGVAMFAGIASLAPLLLLAAPTGGLESTERPLGDAPTHAPSPAAMYGLCEQPQNADSFPSRPVPVTKGSCDDTQTFSATSAQPSSGSPCGGYTVAFGPAGDLRPNLVNVNMIADWGDAPLTEA